ncbi:expressed unknown protein [Seminavis robusta]|uniref:Lipoxygenase domain-containing protein n=1 Tax=Seminavis robusta TaxID=568900 RepID=A0A9N8E0A7_9STRA|nr:expressed unknown protein [Seminavis robusta]|eukprot:Sro384_g131380.1 n/a (577) ;mRNA; r:6565-8567
MGASQSKLSDESKEILSKMDKVTQTMMSAAPEKAIQANENPPPDTCIQTDKVDLGWVKNQGWFGGGSASSSSTASADDDNDRELSAFQKEEWAKVSIPEEVFQVSKSFTAHILRSDDNFGDYTTLEELTNGWLRNTWIFPFEDVPLFTPSRLAEGLAEQLEFVQGRALPVSYTNDFDTISDESFSRFFFYGMGAVLLEKQQQQSASPSQKEQLGPFVVDMNLSHTKMREGFRPLASRVHFSKDQTVTAIYDYSEETIYKPGEAGWEAAKFCARCAAFTLITVREHLTWSHIVLSNSVTRGKTLHLPPNHPIRRLLTVFTFRTTEVNTAAFDVLVPENCVLHRGLGYDYTAMVDLFEHSYTSCNVFEPFPKRKLLPELEELAQAGKFPYWTQGKAYYEIVQAFVTEWMEQAEASASGSTTDDHAKAFYESIQTMNQGQQYTIPDYSDSESSAMVDLLTQFIWTVTAYHELVGNVVDVTLKPDRCGIRCVPGQTRVDVQAYLIALTISSSTSVRMPELMSRFENFFGAGGAPGYERDVWEHFQSRLKEQSLRVQEEDEKRDVEFKYFDPVRFECSVSV